MNKKEVLSRKVRLKTGLTQEKFAKKYGIPVSTVRKHDQLVGTPGRSITIYYKLIEQYPDEIAVMVSNVLKK